jgi:enoyl-CoA hydratase/carnithine racemase
MPDFLYSLSDGVATVTFNRPEALNALTFDVYAQFRDLLAQMAHDPAVKVLILTGAGRAFCSGGDVNEIIGPLLERDVEGHLAFTRMTGAVVENMRRLDRPIIAAINGVAAGAGAVIALAADLRIAADSASFRFLFTSVGLTGADMGAAYLLPRVVGMGRATEILLFGDKIGAGQAERLGLVNKVTPLEDLLPTAQEWAARLAAGPTAAIAMTKRMLNNEWNMDLGSALEAEAQAQALMLMNDDHREFYEDYRRRKKGAVGQ